METKKIIKIRSLTPPTVCESELGPAREQQEFESNEVRVSLLADVDDDTARPWGIFPKRIFARRSPSPDSANKNNKRWKLTILSENPTDVEKSLIKFTWTSRNLSGSKTQWKKENLLLLSVSRCDNATMCRNLRHNVFFSTSMEKGPFTKLLNCPLSHSGSGGAFFSPSS